MTGTVHMWTDGGGVNPGKGAWAFILLLENRAKIVSGVDLNSTNNRMETMAVLMGLRELKKPTTVHVHTDSMYVVWGLNKLKKKRTLKTNPDIWEQVLPLFHWHTVTWEHTSAHADDLLNNLADFYVGQAFRYNFKMDKRIDGDIYAYAMQTLHPKRWKQINGIVS